MQARFTIDADVERDLIRVTMGGFFAPADLARFAEARAAAHRRLTCRPNRHLTLNDVREMKIQSQEIVTAFQKLLAAPEYQSRKLAFVVGPTLTRGQLKRALGERDAAFFDAPEAAEAWLLAA